MTLKVKVDGTFVATGGGAEPDENGWVRPADWLAMPTVESTDQKFVGLLAVTNNDSNHVALLARGAYTVDWGDGSAPEDVADNVQANHAYDYSAISNDTLSERGYKQVLVTVTPQGAGNLTQLTIDRRPTQFAAAKNAQWLDLIISGPSMTSLTLRGSLSFSQWVERVTIKSHALTSTANLFNNMRALQSVPLFDTSSVTTMNAMFGACSSLQSVPLFNTVNNKNMNTMFNGCFRLKTIPLLNTVDVTDIGNCFPNCDALNSLPALNLSAVTSVTTNIFAGTTASLSSAPFSGLAVDISFLNQKLGPVALNAIFTGLADRTALDERTIIVTGNWGVGQAGYDATIATDKNWVVTA